MKLILSMAIGAFLLLGTSAPVVAQDRQIPAPRLGIVSLAAGQVAQLNVVFTPLDEVGTPTCRVTLGFVDKRGELFLDEAGEPVLKTVTVPAGQIRTLKLPDTTAFIGQKAGKQRVRFRAVVGTEAVDSGSPPTDTLPLECGGLHATVEVYDKVSGKTELVVTAHVETLRLDYPGGYTIWLDCERHGAVKFRYNAQRDTGDFERSTYFRLDPEVSTYCQQYTAASYRRPEGEKPTYDRGHLVPANHLDHSEVAIRESNYMTNILPQVAQMNRGAWRHTEEIIECYRDIDELLILGGVIWGDDPRDDYFFSSHGVATPDAFWKVVIRGDGRVISWIIDNHAEATYKNLDHYLVPVRHIEALTDERIPVEDFRKDEVPPTSWLIPVGCDRG